MNKLYKLILINGLILLTGCTNQPNTSSVANAYSDEIPHNAAEAYAYLGRQYLIRDTLDLAEARLKYALKLNPELPAAHHDLAVVYTKTKNFELADEEYQLALKFASNDSTVLYNYATLLYNQDRYDDAELQLQKLLDNHNNDNRAQVYEALGMIALKKNDNNKVESYFIQALNINKTLTRSLIELVKLYINADKLVVAKNYLQRYQEIARDTPEGLWFGILIARAEKNEQMIDEYSRRLRIKFPDSPQAQQMLSTKNNR